MKISIKAVLMFFLGALAIRAEEFRIWTEAATSRKIEAKFVEKDDAAKTATLMLKTLKNVKIEISKLAEEDQKYIREWVEIIEPKDQLTVRVVATGQKGSGTKKLEVDVRAVKADVTVRGGCVDHDSCGTLSKTVKAGERGVFQINSHDKYTFTLTDASGAMIDEETATKKTGKTSSR